MAIEKDKKIEEGKGEIIKGKNSELDKLLKGVEFLVVKSKETDDRFDKLEKKIKRFETGKDDRFKEEAKVEDIKEAADGREKIDPRTVKIVDEVLGEDFKIRINSNEDKPGFLFTLIVPNRLSLLDKDSRPVKNLATGVYIKNKNGDIKMETFQPEDKRSRQIASTDSYNTIKKHCEKVRSNIVSTYQKLNRPIPEFKLKQSI